MPVPIPSSPIPFTLLLHLTSRKLFRYYNHVLIEPEILHLYQIGGQYLVKSKIREIQKFPRFGKPGKFTDL